jgi:hypothetical protein
MLQTADVLAALRDWAKRSASLTDAQAIRSHQNGPEGPGADLPYVVVQPIAGLKQVSLQPTIKTLNGHRYKLITWEITSQIDAYRGEPADILILLEAGLVDPVIRKAAFLDRGFTVHGHGPILDSPQSRGQFWERHAQLRLTLRCTTTDQADLPLATAVKFTLEIDATAQAVRAVYVP